jgi:uncharacterized membrane protein
MWIALVLFYGVAKGVRDGIKKKAVEKSGVMEVLFLYTALSFVLTIPFSSDVFSMPPIYYIWIFIKSFFIFLAFIFSFYSIKKMPVSLYGVLDSTRMLFSTLLALLFLGEVMTVPKLVGLLLVLGGVIFVNFRQSNEEKVKLKYLAMAIAYCFLNAVSGFMDKKLMSSGDLTASQMQFWYMFFMAALYGIYMLVTKTPIKLETIKTNYWIPISSILFVLADRALFIANADPASEVTVMTLIKQSSIIITVLSGWLIFKEKHILKRLICAFVIMLGILIATLF